MSNERINAGKGSATPTMWRSCRLPDMAPKPRPTNASLRIAPHRFEQHFVGGRGLELRLPDLLRAHEIALLPQHLAQVGGDLGIGALRHRAPKIRFRIVQIAEAIEPPD